MYPFCSSITLYRGEGLCTDGITVCTRSLQNSAKTADTGSRSCLNPRSASNNIGHYLKRTSEASAVGELRRQRRGGSGES